MGACRDSRTGTSVVASAQALGWKDIHGVITEGRLDDFFDYSDPFHIVTFNLKGAPTVEWKRAHDSLDSRARPGELIITPAGEGHSIRQLRSGRGVQLRSQSEPISVPRRAGLERTWIDDQDRRIL